MEDEEKKISEEKVSIRLESPEKSEAYMAGWDAGHRAAMAKFSYMLLGMYLASLMYFLFLRAGE